MGLLKKCPFCGEVPDTAHCSFLWVEANNHFFLTHDCVKDGEFVGTVTIHGKTAEEVFQRWNDRIEEKG